MNALASSLVLTAVVSTVFASCGPFLCPPGYTKWQTNCYKLFDEVKNWAAAEQRCVADGAHLASVHSAAENNFVNQMALQGTAGGQETWIGLNDLQTENSFVWTDGSPIDYTNWELDEPNDFYPGEDCSHLNHVASNGEWNDFYCDQEFRFICKK
ncbi:alpha-N-acetylgalactosamine-specific lectin-like [Acanthaster planci]|uniref:Alpha-N-acetylgalactosamine-specific lectin-like n=1 Tax=Acanthaster planci TaxID=133434 RepID=A0A8B8A7C3_ACAPL|nr:alpha-N-acetylgalactosamine-specific lectin-like [Acanthaster planci]